MEVRTRSPDNLTTLEPGDNLPPRQEATAFKYLHMSTDELESTEYLRERHAVIPLAVCSSVLVIAGLLAWVILVVLK